MAECENDQGMKPKVFNDSIHGHVALNPLLVRMIDTPQFQRLRNIKQLGGGYFVFPGASHNRFEHSIGVAYLAGKLVKSLKEKQPELGITDSDVLCVEIAGLCHDMGHGPFSHLFDGLFISKVRQDQKCKHENISTKMFDHMVKVNDLEKLMVEEGLQPVDQIFIKEMIAHLDTNANAGEMWPYKGRSEDKSFLYEIVANKINGIDVDKFDYFARDCHHLGIQNNFDHNRFIMFARVCEVGGKKHICMRVKEVRNLYDMFYTRISLHRRAYQHRVNKVIEVMIAEAFVKADKYIEIIGSGGERRCLSEAIDDMEAYTKLTDCVFDQILNSSSPNLAEARQILKRVVSRDLYMFLGKTKAKGEQDEEPINVTQKLISTWKTELADPGLQPEDFEVIEVLINYGKKNKNPFDEVYFYSKNDCNTAHRIAEDQMSDLRPNCFSETLIMVYYKKKESVEVAKTHYCEWCHSKGFQVGDTVGL